MAIAAQPAVVDDAFMERYFQAFRSRDLATLSELVTDDVVLESAFGPETCGKRFTGRQGFLDATTRYFDTLPNVRSYDRTYTVAGNKGFTEFTVSFTDPSGKLVETRVCDIFDFRDGRISSKRAYSKRLQEGGK